MEKSTLVEILRTFTKEELAAFSDFSASPYFNKKSNVTKLFESLKKFAPLYPPEKISKEEIWKKVFPGKKYNYGIMKNLIFDLNKLAVKFLELENYSARIIEQELCQLEAFRYKNLKQLYIKRAADTMKNLGARPLDNQSHLYRYMLYSSEMSYLDYEMLFEKGDTDYHSVINDSLLLNYCTNQIYHGINNLQYAHNRKASLNSEIHLKALRLLDESGLHDPYAEILKFLYIAFSGPGSREDYENLKQSFFRNYRKCSETVQYDLAVAMINFCRNNAQRGNSEFIKDEFIYIKLLIGDSLYKSTKISWIDQYLFMQAVMAACRAGEFEWAERFITERSSELLDSVKEQYTNMAYITLNLRRGRFHDALQYISRVKNVDKGDKLNIKVFEFNAYYELNYYDELKALADTTHHLLRSDRLFSQEEKEHFKEYVKAITWLMEYKCGSDKNKGNRELLQKTEKFVEERKIRNKLWLLQKIEELKNRL